MTTLLTLSSSFILLISNNNMYQRGCSNFRIEYPVDSYSAKDWVLVVFPHLFLFDYIEYIATWIKKRNRPCVVQQNNWKCFGKFLLISR